MQLSISVTAFFTEGVVDYTGVGDGFGAVAAGTAASRWLHIAEIHFPLISLCNAHYYFNHCASDHDLKTTLLYPIQKVFHISGVWSVATRPLLFFVGVCKCATITISGCQLPFNLQNNQCLQVRWWLHHRMHCCCLSWFWSQSLVAIVSFLLGLCNNLHNHMCLI